MTRLCERLDARACNKRLRHPYLSYTEALRRSCHVEHRSSSAPAPTPGFLRPSTGTCGAPLKVTGGFPELVLRARGFRFNPKREARRPSPADDGELSSSRCFRLIPTTRKVTCARDFGGKTPTRVAGGSGAERGSSRRFSRYAADFVRPRGSRMAPFRARAVNPQKKRTAMLYTHVLGF